MKNTIVILALIMLMFAACGHKLKESEVPVTVKEAFKIAHGDAKDVDWEKEDANYEAEFEVGENEQSVVIDVNGNILETEIGIKEGDLPANVREYIASNYNNTKITEAAMITDSNGVVTYEAEINEKDLIFDSKGNFMKEEVEKDDDND